MLADLKYSSDDDEECRLSSPLRKQHFCRLERSRLQVSGQFGQLLRLQGFEKGNVLKNREHWVRWLPRTLVGYSNSLRRSGKVETGIVELPP